MRLAYRRTALAGAALGIALAGILSAGILSSPADSRVFFGVGVGVPLYAPIYPPPVYYAPPPVYYAPPPVYYAPPPVAVAPPAPLQQNSAAQNWYYCDASRAYYPHVTSCASGWREVAPSAAQR
jgi:hypothetical protein